MKYIALLVLFFVPSVVFGCSLTQDADRFKSPEENVDSYQYIFVATVTQKDELSGRPANSYEMTVSSDISGNVPDVLRMSSPRHSCGSFFEVGTELLIITNDLSEIDEITPQYYLQNESDRDATVASVMQAFKSTNSPTLGACTKELRPVCAERVVQCVTTPCPPILETFSNKCLAELEDVTILYEGECEMTNERPVVVNTTPPPIDFVGPTNDPREGFVEPTSLPPVTVQSTQSSGVLNNIFDSIRSFFRKLFFGNSI